MLLLEISPMAQRILSTPPIHYLGKHSFGIYVLHTFVFATFSCWPLVQLKDVLDLDLTVLIGLIGYLTVLMIFLKPFTKYIDAWSIKVGQKVSASLTDGTKHSDVIQRP